MKQVNPQVNVVGVEPAGSTLFGGEPLPYLSAGSGMHGSSRLLIQYGNCIDYFAKVPDIAAALECKKIEDHEGLCVGLTTGHNLAVASSIAAKTTDIVVVVSADSGKHYQSEIEKLCKDNSAANEIPELKRYSRNEKSD